MKKICWARECCRTLGGLVMLALLGGGSAAGASPNGVGAHQVGSTPFLHGGAGMKESMPFAPSIQALAVTPEGMVYAGSFGMGVFRSSDQGATWEAVNAGLTDLFILCLAVSHDGRIYAGTVRGGVFRTTPGGQTWEAIPRGLKRVEVKSLLATATGLFAGTGRGVYEWRETEGKWGMMLSDLDQLLIPSLAMLDDQTLLAATAGKGLMGLVLEGKEPSPWERPPSKLVDPKERLPHRYLRVVVVNDRGHIILGTQDGGIFRSTDSGMSWHPISRSLPNDSIRAIVSYKEGLFVATGRGVFKLNRQERRWKPVNTGLTDLAIQVLIVTDTGVLYAGTSEGAFRSDNAGRRWVNISQGFGLHISQPTPF